MVPYYSHQIYQSPTILSTLVYVMILLGACQEQDPAQTNETAPCTQPEQGCFSTTWIAQANSYELRLVKSEPEQPERGMNQWLVELSLNTQTEERLSSCTMSLRPFMPEHGHDSPIKPNIAEQELGQYEVTDLVFNMPGLWTLEFFITCPSIMETEEIVTYSFWLDS